MRDGKVTAAARIVGLAAVCCAWPLSGLAAKGPKPEVRLTLESLGIPPLSQSFLEAGYSMLSLHFVDASHLLVTYGLRGLVERVAGDPPEDDDRAVAALLVELPSGKVLARTRWHLHDHGQYLWALGDGRFLLRNRSVLTAFAPLRNLAGGDAFLQTAFLHPTGQIDRLLISPEGDLLTVESSPKRVENPASKAGAREEERLRRGPELYSFVRVRGTGTADDPVLAVSAGALRAPGIGTIPLNARGYLTAKETARDRWKVEFDSFDGGSKTLQFLDSTCPPTMEFVSPGQYLAFSCRGADDRIMVSAFDFAPHEMWEELLGTGNALMRLAYAPQAGRFAMSRVVSTVSAAPGDGRPALQGAVVPLGDLSTVQEVRVYQTESGDLLFQLPNTPVLRAGQNFDMTQDGSAILLLRGGVIEVYKLPVMSGRDRKELAEAQSFEPAAAAATMLTFRRMMKEAAVEAAEVENRKEASPVAEVAPPPARVTPAEQKAAVQNGDTQGERRKPPTLLNPGESTESGKPK